MDEPKKAITEQLAELVRAAAGALSGLTTGFQPNWKSLT
jgi:hypothetical protein